MIDPVWYTIMKSISSSLAPIQITEMHHGYLATPYTVLSVSTTGIFNGLAVHAPSTTRVSPAGIYNVLIITD